MAKCPVCQTENTADFGLVNCQSCGSPFFVDIDGSASNSVAPEAPPAAPAATEAEPPPPMALESFDDVEPMAPAVAEAPAQVEPPPVREPPPVPETPLATEGPMEFVAPMRDETPGEAPALFDNPLPEPPAEAAPIEDLRQIAEYGNSDVSLAREGAYRFTLYIGGIDTAEIRQEVRDNLADSRFLWDIDALLATIKEGELVIPDVSAVKAALAIQRLKLLPVDLKWEQHAIHQNH